MKIFSALLAICAGHSPVTGEFPAQRPVTRGFDIYFDLLLNKRLSKQSWGWWFEMPSCPLCHYNDFYRRIQTYKVQLSFIVRIVAWYDIFESSQERNERYGTYFSP